VLFADELLSLGKADPKVKFARAISRETLQRASDCARRIDSAVITDLVTLLPRMPAHVFVCGSNAFLNIAAYGALMGGFRRRL
jgi:hypothetical protein